MADNFVINHDGGSYASKMDNVLTQAVRGWWEGLSKEELLSYLAEQPTISADNIRAMIGNMNCVLAFDVRYSSASGDAATDFHRE